MAIGAKFLPVASARGISRTSRSDLLADAPFATTDVKGTASLFVPAFQTAYLSPLSGHFVRRSAFERIEDRQGIHVH